MSVGQVQAEPHRGYRPQPRLTQRRRVMVWGDTPVHDPAIVEVADGQVVRECQVG
jgi:hypothetical protein